MPRALVEPFVGGGAMVAHAAARWPGLPIVFGGANADLTALYAAVRDGRKAFYYDLRARSLGLPNGHEATALLYFLMRTGLNGVWQTCRASKSRDATPVGLVEQYDRVLDSDAVLAWSRALVGAEIRTGDWRGTAVPGDAFVFCDPPYRGSCVDDGRPFSDADLADLAAWRRDLARRQGRTAWLCSRDLGDGVLEGRGGRRDPAVPYYLDRRPAQAHRDGARRHACDRGPPDLEALIGRTAGTGARRTDPSPPSDRPESQAFP